MKSAKLRTTRLGIVLMFVVMGACLCVSSARAGQTVFTRYNIHVQEQIKRNGQHVFKASYANYTNPGTGHILLAAGTKIEIVKESRKEFVFFVPDKNMKVEFEYHEPRMGMSVEQYIGVITSPTPVSYANLSEIDQKGIAEGKACVGMTREGVLAALGYPAAHRTPSLDSPTWIYWTNRFGTVAVNFDDKGIVTGVKN